ncbi:MAG: hypothetical protein L0I24_24955, partial [Pseudonocardia sp.]|nr:hypothetical protein [Pseudonocardia sp.]
MTLGTGLRRGGPHAVAAAIAVIRPELVSTDLFDTVLLRDSSLETSRLAEACHRAAPQLGVDARALTALRWEMQDAAYRAVALERPDGDASLTAVCAAAVTALGRGPEQARILHDAELEVA